MGYLELDTINIFSQVANQKGRVETSLELFFFQIENLEMIKAKLPKPSESNLEVSGT